MGVGARVHADVSVYVQLCVSVFVEECAYEYDMQQNTCMQSDNYMVVLHELHVMYTCVYLHNMQ